MNESLKNALKKFDSMTEPIDEFIILEELNKIARENKGSFELNAEIMAFEFMESKEDGKLGPKHILKSDDGTLYEYPDLKNITQETIDYWIFRSDECMNPVLRARYSDLVWESTKKIDYAIKTIDSIISIASNNLYSSDVGVKRKLKRALALSIQINNSNKIEQVKKAILSYEEKIAQDDMVGTWGFSYDLLMFNKKIKLTQQEEERIIKDLIDRMFRLMKNGEPSSVEVAVKRLAEYYRRKNNIEELEKILEIHAEYIINYSDNNESSLLSLQLLHKTLNLVSDYGRTRLGEKLSKAITELGPKINSEMTEVSHKLSVPIDKMNEFVSKMLDGDMENALERIAISFIPKIKDIKDVLYELAQEAPLSFLIPKQILDSQGRIVATIGTLEEDETGNIIHQMSQNLSIQSIFLREVLDNAIQKYDISEDSLINYFYRSPAFDEQKRQIILSGVRSYLQKDYISALHLLVPMIEDCFRKIVRMSGGTILERSRDGSSLLYKQLDKLLREECLKEVFGEDFLLYCRVLLTDQRGWNVRNNVCHGLLPENAFGSTIADRIIHVFLCLSLVSEY